MEDRCSISMMRQRLASARRLLREVDGGLDQLGRGRHSARAAAGASHHSPRECENWLAVENGEERLVAEQEADELLTHSPADLVLHVPNTQLRYLPSDADGNAGPQRATVSAPLVRILRVGMSKPGRPFGNRTLNRMSRVVRLTQRTLSRYMVPITKLVQGGGTSGPYIRRVSGVYTESDTGFGYLFDDRFHYLVIDRCNE